MLQCCNVRGSLKINKLCREAVVEDENIVPAALSKQYTVISLNNVMSVWHAL